jgi:hypothetical protein
MEAGGCGQIFPGPAEELERLKSVPPLRSQVNRAAAR